MRAVLAANEPTDLLGVSTSASNLSSNSGEPARGLGGVSADNLAVLRRCSERLGVALRRELCTMVEAWCDACLRSRQLPSCARSTRTSRSATSTCCN